MGRQPFSRNLVIIGLKDFPEGVLRYLLIHWMRIREHLIEQLDNRMPVAVEKGPQAGPTSAHMHFTGSLDSWQHFDEAVHYLPADD
jgi:hypothetical protein